MSQSYPPPSSYVHAFTHTHAQTLFSLYVGVNFVGHRILVLSILLNCHISSASCLCWFALPTTENQGSSCSASLPYCCQASQFLSMQLWIFFILICIAVIISEIVYIFTFVVCSALNFVNCLFMSCFACFLLGYLLLLILKVFRISWTSIELVKSPSKKSLS